MLAARAPRNFVGGRKSCFFIEFWVDLFRSVNSKISCGQRFLQNLAIRRLRKVMIKTSFQLFLLIKSANFRYFFNKEIENKMYRNASFPVRIWRLFMWTRGNAKKKNCSYYPEHFRFHFYSFKTDWFLVKTWKNLWKTAVFEAGNWK